MDKRTAWCFVARPGLVNANVYNTAVQAVFLPFLWASLCGGLVVDVVLYVYQCTAQANCLANNAAGFLGAIIAMPAAYHGGIVWKRFL